MQYSMIQYNTVKDQHNKSNIIAAHCERVFSVHFMKGIYSLFDNSKAAPVVTNYFKLLRTEIQYGEIQYDTLKRGLLTYD